MSDLTFAAYQERAMSTAIYPRRGSNISYPVLGLCGEAGEIANKVKKIERDAGGVISDEVRKAISKEVGDTLWYCAALSFELKLSLEDIARANLEKLAKRKEDGTLGGSGDQR